MDGIKLNMFNTKIYNKTSKNNEINRQTYKKFYKTNNKLNNIISITIEQYNKYDRKEVYKLTCTNCNKFYIGRTNRNFNTSFKEHRKDFRYAEGKSKFSEHVHNEGHEMKTIEETMSIIHLENSHRKINTPTQ